MRVLPALLFACCACLGLSGARAAEAPAIAMHGEPALPADFTHLPYADPAAPKGGTLRVGFLGAFDSLNPFNLKAGSTAQGLIGNVYQSLMVRSLDEPFTLYGLVARTIETDEARSFATFRLDSRARFSDGTPITADDVLFTFELLREKGRPQQRNAYALVRRADVQDPLTIRFDLTGADDRELPLTLAFMPVLPRHATDLARFADSNMTPPLASGPYTVASVEPGTRFVLRRNPVYWGADLPVHRGLYNFDEIVISYYRDANSLFEAFKAGLLDYREETSPTRWLTGYEFAAMADGRDRRAAIPLGVPKGLEGFVFNTRRPPFDDVRVREALGMMFDFEWIDANLFGGLYRRTKSFFDESDLSSVGRPASAAERALLAPFPGAVREDILEGRWRPPVSDGSGRDRDAPRRALALMAEAGFAVHDGRLVKGETPLDFEIMVQDRNQERLALNYAASLARIGVLATVRSVDEVQYQRRRQKFDFDAMLGSWLASASPGNEQRSRWGSASAGQDASFNLAGARSAAIDALIVGMLQAKTEGEFVEIVRAYDRVLLSGFYVVPLYHAGEAWIAYSNALGHPDRVARYANPPFGATLDSWWRKPAP